MKFLLIFTKKSVPEWKECYYDYANIKSLVILCKKGYAIKCNIEDLSREDNYSIEETAILMQNRDVLNHIRSTKTEKIYEIMNETNCIFYKYHSLSKRVVFLFCQFKIHQLNARLDKYQKWEPLVEETKEDLLQLLANCYAENIKLETMTQLHLEAYEKVFKKHEKAFKLFGLNSPSLNSARMARTLSDLQRYSLKVESTLDSYQEVVHRENKFKLEEEIEPSPFRVSIISYLFGLFNGFSICVLITSIILLGINIGTYKEDNEDLATQRILLRNQFRLWKGNGLIILYIWVFGISFYIFERKRINYNLIFDYNSKTKKSTARLGFATFVTIIWCSFFIFYVMDLIDIYQVADVGNPPIPITIYFPIIIFGIFLISIAVEFWRNKKDIMFVLFTILKILLTPFGFFTISFSVIWATEQITSLVQIMFDLSYSACYYSRTLKNATINPDPCLGITIMVEIIIIILYAIRLLQCIRLALKNQTFLGTREMYRFIRAALQLALASISLSSDENNKGYLWAWIPIASVCGLYSFLIDVLLDFNLYLIENDEEGKVKIVPRPQNIFSIHIIRVLVVLNFIFRYNFLLTISPRIIFTYIPNAELIITVASVVELLRRLIWNLLRVENEQIKNNFFFQIRTDYEDRERRIMKELKEKGIEWAAEPAALQERNVKELDTLREYLVEKSKMQEKVLQFHAKNDKILEDLEESAESEIGRLVAQ